MNRLFILLLASTAFVSALSPEDVCAKSCQKAIKSFRWSGCEGSRRASCSVDLPQVHESIALCLNQHCRDPSDRWQSLYPGLAAEFDAILSSAEQTAALEPLDHSTPIPTAIDFNAETFNNAQQTVETTTNATYTSTTLFSIILIGAAMWAALLAAVRYGWLSTQSRRTIAEDGSSPGRSSWLNVHFKKSILMPGILKTSKPHLYGFAFSMPTRAQAVLVLSYIIINIVACFWGINTFNDNIDYPGNRTAQAIKLVADKTGIMAIYNLPLLLVFSSRNNGLIWLTGSSFATFNTFHRWVARVSVVQAAVHSVLYLIVFDNEDITLATAYQNVHLRYGTVATIAGCMIVFQAVHFFRRLHYELFLVIHIVLAVLWLSMTWLHIRQNGRTLDTKWSSLCNWCLAAVCIWVTDRMIRFFRIVWYNLRFTGNGAVTSRATVDASESGYMQLSIKLARNWTFAPGQYVYISFGGSHRYLQSHPFSVLSYEPDKASAGSMPILKLMIKPGKGVTQRLKKMAIKGGDHMCFVEGPYGHSLPLQNWDNVTLVSAGVGITAVFGHAKSAALMRHANLHLIIIFRDEVQARGLYSLVEEMAEENPNIRVDIFITAAAPKAPIMIELNPGSEKDAEKLDLDVKLDMEPHASLAPLEYTFNPQTPKQTYKFGESNTFNPVNWQNSFAIEHEQLPTTFEPTYEPTFVPTFEPTQRKSSVAFHNLPPSSDRRKSSFAIEPARRKSSVTFEPTSRKSSGEPSSDFNASRRKSSVVFDNQQPPSVADPTRRKSSAGTEGLFSAYTFGGPSVFASRKSSMDEKKSFDDDFPFLPNVNVCRTYGRRPSIASLRGLQAVEADNIASLLEADAQAAGSLAVIACGPGALIDDCRKACVGFLSTNNDPIEFFSESFEW